MAPSVQSTAVINSCNYESMMARHAQNFPLSQIKNSTAQGQQGKVYSHSNAHKIPCLLLKLKKFALISKTETSA